jgi:hypothetical protein
LASIQIPPAASNNRAAALNIRAFTAEWASGNGGEAGRAGSESEGKVLAAPLKKNRDIYNVSAMENYMNRICIGIVEFRWKWL